MNAQPENATRRPAERLLREDLHAGAFTAGADRGYWRLRSLEWPFAVIEVSAARRENAPDWWSLRFDLDGYPQAPSARLWDPDANMPLPPGRWPAGGPRVMSAFNPGWRSEALYLPVDRLALEGHEVWRERHGCYIWDPARDITQYLRLVHELLWDHSYTGARG